MKKHLIYILFPALLLTGCVTDEQLVGPVASDELQATLTLQIPEGGFTPAATRALDDTKEKTISQVDVLIFEKASADAADNTAVFFDRAEVDLSGNGTESRDVQITVKKSTKPLQFVVLANCRALVDEKAASFVAGTTTRTAALDALIMTVDSGWNANSTSYTPLPMWGQTAFRTITDAASAATTVDMVRAHARIDVTLSATAQSQFILERVYVYNASSRGRIAPSEAWTSGTLALPTSRGDLDYNIATGARESVYSIYTFEAPAATAANQTTAAPFLVIGGTWNGETALTYYRIDFAKTENNVTTFMPLLRNYHYDVNIEAVSGRGYPTTAEAMLDSFTDRITTSVHQWAQGDMGNIVWNGRNYLAVTTNELDTDKGEKNISNIKIATNYDNGCTASVAFNPTDGEGWIMVPSVPFNTSGVGTLNITVREATSNNRTATITVTAGRLKQNITVTQLFNDRLSLDVGDVEVIFPAKTIPAAFLLPVEWDPAHENVSVELISVGHDDAGNYPQLTGYAGLTFTANPLPVSGTISDADNNFNNGGMAQLSLKPDAATLAAFAERRSILKITSFDNGTDEPLVKTVLLRQFDYQIVVSGEMAAYQPNTTYSLTVRSNGQWNVASEGAVTYLSQTTDNDPNTTGITVSFKTGSTLGAAPKLIFTQPVNGVTKEVLFPPITQMLPNCYIVYPEPGENIVEIPIAKVFEVWDSDRDLNGQRVGDASAMDPQSNYTAELLWQDEIDLIPNTGTPVIVENPLNDYTKAHIKVTVNTVGKEGNAVVVLKEDGVIRWSWHVWVLNSDNDPTVSNYKTAGTYTIMDRNLGATTNFAPIDNNDVRSFGLLYQWGKNIPFPGVRTTNVGSASKYIYTLGGTTPLSETTGDTPGTGVYRTGTTVARNLAGALMNPLTFYTGVTTPGTSQNDWYANAAGSTNENHRTDFWGAYKTYYDPCPDGWRVPEREFLYTVMPTAWTDYRGMDLGAAGFVPSAGYRIASSGNPSVSGRGFWGNRASGQGIGNLCSYGLNYITPNNSIQNASGYTVRCVKIE